MSFLDDLANAAERIADKALDFKIAEAGGFVGPAQAAGAPTAAPLTPVQTVPLSDSFQRFLPFIAIGGLGLGLILVLRS